MISLDWTGHETFLKTEAERDLSAGAPVRPCMLALQGEQPLFRAFLRPCDPDGCHDPLIELLALAWGLDADRLALSAGGRAWSLEDPIPPAAADSDLRGRVLVVRTAEPQRSRTAVFPFEVNGGAVRWADPVRVSGGEGWIVAALAHFTRVPKPLTSRAEVRGQAQRCAALGHLLFLSPATGALLEIS